MSSFNCEHCGTAIIDTPRGYVTSCEHHKAENINKVLSRHLEGDCHCHAGKICKVCELGVMEKLHNLVQSQVDIPSDFMVVVNELNSINFDVNSRGNVNG